jgi:hypothetical protein
MSEFHTTDIGLAAVLLYERYEFIGIIRKKPSAEFVFKESKHLKDTVERYWVDTLRLPAQSLLHSLKLAKRILYNQKHDEEL